MERIFINFNQIDMSENNQLSIKEAIVQELTRCKQDPIYFVKNII
jgi:hypothetical protein